jgi:predicted dehydrogenase
MTRVTVIGCGGWGSRVARRLREHEQVSTLVVVDEDLVLARTIGRELDCTWSGDPLGYLGVSGTASSTVEGGYVVIATPPNTRLPLVRAVLGGYGAKPERIRIEKPLATSMREAHEIAALCADAGVELTVGFTLLHHPLYDAVFDLINDHGLHVESVCALRIGRAANHATTAMLDLGIHAASIAAHLGIDEHNTTITTGYNQFAAARSTTLKLTNGDTIHIDEMQLTATWREHTIYCSDNHDALGKDIDAWLGGAHRGTVSTAINAQTIVSHPNLREVVA